MLLLLTLACADLSPSPGKTAAAVEPAAPAPAQTQARRCETTPPVYVDGPQSGGLYPAVVLVPGTGNSGDKLLSPRERSAFVDRGIVLVRYDPPGRGANSGERDDGGAIDQAALACVIEQTLERADVSRVGVVSLSYGVQTAVGTMSAPSPPPAEWVIDWEGPSSRTWSAGCDDGKTGGNYQGHTCADAEFWERREAARTVGRLKVPYLRLQCKKDHVHKDKRGHAEEMVDAAVTGSVPWVGYNDAVVSAPGAVKTTPRLGCKQPRGELLAGKSKAMFERR